MDFLHPSLRSILVIILFCGVIVGCASTPRADPRSNTKVPELSPDQKSYLISSSDYFRYKESSGVGLKSLRPGNTLHIRVLDQEVDKQVAVKSNGNIVLPLIGIVRVTGRTVSELETELEKKYTEWFRRPKVAVRLQGSSVQNKDEVRILFLPENGQAKTVSFRAPVTLGQALKRRALRGRIPQDAILVYSRQGVLSRERYRILCSDPENKWQGIQLRFGDRLRFFQTEKSYQAHVQAMLLLDLYKNYSQTKEYLQEHEG